jgi:hypothetical protein
MNSADQKRDYYRLDVTGSHPKTDIWLVDDQWHLVQKATGVLRTSVLTGRYFIEFGPARRDGVAHPIELTGDLRRTQQELEADKNCPRQPPQFIEEE